MSKCIYNSPLYRIMQPASASYPAGPLYPILLVHCIRSYWSIVSDPTDLSLYPTGQSYSTTVCPSYPILLIPSYLA